MRLISSEVSSCCSPLTLLQIVIFILQKQYVPVPGSAHYIFAEQCNIKYTFYCKPLSHKQHFSQAIILFSYLVTAIMASFVLVTFDFQRIQCSFHNKGIFCTLELFVEMKAFDIRCHNMTWIKSIDNLT